MPRTRKSNPLMLPPFVYAKHGGIYFRDANNKWHRLGKEWDVEARKLWVQLSGEPAITGTMVEIFEAFRTSVVPEKSPRTQQDYNSQLNLLIKAFGGMRGSDIKTKHLKGYLDRRTAKVQGNREISLLGYVLRWANNKGYVEFERNPADGVMYNPEKPRERYVEDDELRLFLEYCQNKSQPLIALLCSFMYLTGQRRVDVLSLRLDAFTQEKILIRQSKRGARLNMERTPQLDLVIEGLRALRPNVTTEYLVCTRQGNRYTGRGIMSMYGRLMDGAIKDGVLKERFRMQDLRPKTITDIGGGQRAKVLAGHRTQSTTDRIYTRNKKAEVRPVL